ncbi:MAG: YggT family protein [Sphaerochaetaceae bacterium]|nr:YggT family protein [Sphaerochaetaceae bacterium]
MTTNIYEIASFLAKALELYSFLIWIRILLTWINPFPKEGSLTSYFAMIVDPYLNIFRSRRLMIGMLDFSAIIGIGVIQLLQSALKIFAYYHTFRFAWFLQLCIQMVWQYCIQIFIILLIVFLVLRTLGSLFHSPSLMRAGLFAEPLLKKLQMALFPNRIVKDLLLCVIALALAILCYFAAMEVMTILMGLTRYIGF